MFMKCLDITSHHLSLTHKTIYAIEIDASKTHFKTSLSKGTCDDLLTRKQLQQLDVLGSVLFHIRKSVELHPSMNLICVKASVSTPRYRRVLFTQLSDVISQVQPQGTSSQYIRCTYTYMAITNQHALSLDIDCMQAARGLELQVARGLQRPGHSTVPVKGHQAFPHRSPAV